MVPEKIRLEFRVLGPFEVRSGGRPLNLGGPQLRGVLARLLVDAGRPVSVAALVGALWGELPPAHAERTVRTYVSRLRKAMQPAGGEDALVTRPPGYELRIDPATVDAARFERLVASGRQALDAQQPRVAAERLTAALDLWRGADAYAEFGGNPAITAEGRRLDRLRLSAIEDRIEADLASGLGGDLVGELESLVRVHPARERLWGQLMVALYRSGRQAEALDAYRDARAVLVADYGVEPAPGLAAIHQQILVHDPRLVPVPAAVPAQLPFAVRDFAGRDGELDRLDALAAAGTVTRAIAVVSGTAGVGKTTLAVRWAHRVAARFPDGQLYANLHGFDPGGAAADPVEVLRGFVEAFGVPADRIPAGADELAALYRSTLAGKRVLVLLDNARDDAQVRPLLPGSAGSLVVVTSRNHLGGLVAAEGAYPLALDILTRYEARAQLVARLGAERVEAEPDAVHEIIERCARLPLALAIAAARAATHPGWSLARLADDLRGAAGALDALQVGDCTTNVRVAFACSYDALTPAAARLFRLIGIHPGCDFTGYAAASLTGLPVGPARALVDELVRASLLTEPKPDRYAMHDLLRAYAAELAAGVEQAAERDAATNRLLDHYLYTAYAADRLVHRYRTPITLAGAAPGASAQPLESEDAAWVWFAAEHASLLAAQRVAGEQGRHDAVWQLAWTLDTYYQRQGLPYQHLASWRLGLAAADLVGDAAVRILCHRRLGDACARAGRHKEAERHLRQALALANETGDADEQADTHRVIARTLSRRGDHEAALAHARMALRLFRTLDHPVAQAAAASSVGHYSTLLGQYDQAQAYLEPALAVARRHRARVVEAHTLHSLGFLAQQTGRHSDALSLFHESLALARDNGDTFSEATVNAHLGDSYAALGEHEQAQRAWRQALRLCREQHRTGEAERVQRQLDGVLAYAT